MIYPEHPPYNGGASSENNEKYQYLLQHMQQAFCIIEVLFDTEGNATDYIFRELNPAFSKHTNLGNVIGKRMKELEPRHEEAWFKIYGDVATTRKSVHFIMSARFIGDYEYEVFALPAGPPGSNEVAVFFNDITDRTKDKTLLRLKEEGRRIKLEEEAVLRMAELKETNDRLEVAMLRLQDDEAMIRGIADAAPDMVYVIDLRTMSVVFANRNMTEMFGKSLKEMRELGADLFADIVHPDDRHSFNANMDILRYTADREVLKMVLRLKNKDGDWHWVRTRGTVYKRDSYERPTHVIGMSEDISREVELRNQNNSLQREQQYADEVQRHELLRATFNAQEEERRRIAESLHNGLGQLLFGVKLSLSNAAGLSGSEQQQALRHTEQMLAEAINTSRRISHELMPTIIEDYGLESAVKDLCRQWEGSLNIKCLFEKLPRKMDKYLQLAIYRIVQELAQNIIKHAETNTADIRITGKKDAIELVVTDRGKGFSMKQISGAGIGLKSMRNKVKLLKGNFRIDSSPGRGTTVRVSIPIRS